MYLQIVFKFSMNYQINVFFSNRKRDLFIKMFALILNCASRFSTDIVPIVVVAVVVDVDVGLRCRAIKIQSWKCNESVSYFFFDATIKRQPTYPLSREASKKKLNFLNGLFHNSSNHYFRHDLKIF